MTAALVAHPAVRKLTFTGSTVTGRKIAQLAAQHIKPVILELGGKAPTVVLDDADVEKAALGATLGSFIHVSLTFVFRMQKRMWLTYPRPVKSACAQNELSSTGLLPMNSAKP